MPITLGELRLYTIEEISEKLNVTQRTLRTYIKAGRLKAQKFGAEEDHLTRLAPPRPGYFS